MQPEFGAEDVRILEEPRAWAGYFSVRKVILQHRLFAGGWSNPITREVFDRGDAVGVLPWDPVSDELIMIEQFRVGAVRGDNSPWMLELVAGIVEPGEDDQEVARREAIEEAALPVTELHPIACFYPSAGACTEQVRLFVGRATRPQQTGIYGCDDENEDIRVHVLARAEVMRLLNAGRIDNGHTLIALLWLQHHGDALRERWLA
jgi:ADP-ribose pyrophosphatase